MFDFDADGDLDLILQNWHRDSKLLVSQGADGHWLQLRLRGVKSNRSAIGAKIRIVHGDRMQTREVTCGAGYMSAQSLVAHFGLGDVERVDRVEIRWPSGIVQVLEKVEANRRLDVVEPANAAVALR